MTDSILPISEEPDRKWQVLLIGGASGTGKTSVSYRLAQYFRVGITEVDDFQVILEKMTTPEQQPALHYWRIHPEAIYLPAERIVENAIAIGEAMQPALNAVIANHLSSHTPLILEGDFILPSLAVQPAFDGELNNGSVQAVFLDEPDEEQLLRNYTLREPESGDQRKRAQVSWLYGQWLLREAHSVNLPIVLARPWKTAFDRILTAIR